MLKQLLLISLLGLALAAHSTKVEPSLAKSLRSSKFANILVKFESGNRAILQSLNRQRFDTKAAKATQLVSALQSFTESSQRNAVGLLRSPVFAYSAVNFKQFWINNELYVKGASPQLISQLESLPEVTGIREERIFQFEEEFTPVEAVNETRWNLNIIEAGDAWGLPGGNNGAGVVVANIDSGVRGTHEALRGNWRADYGWYDGNAQSENPSDWLGHGTHCMGSTAGAGIGVAPGAQWIACGTAGIESDFISCGQWVLCPTRPNGTSPDCSKAPQVVSNSWGIGSERDFYNEITDAWKAVGIIPVFSMGNEGPTCSTGRSPADQDVISVGSTTERDALSSFSSRGPTRNNRVKPEISAPGEDVYSSYGTSDTAYGLMSGTSMAGPHVAGAVALLLSRNPNLTYEQVRDILTKNTDTSGLGNTAGVCGGTNSTTFPNNHYGHGRLNARKALVAVISNF